MSNALFPGPYAGLTFGGGKYPGFSTLVQEAVNGREVRGSFRPYPKWRFKLGYAVLREAAAVDELRSLAGFFLSRRGRWDSWLYTDPDDNATTDYQFATCDGSTTEFQLTRGFGVTPNVFIEPVENVNVVTNIKRNNVALTPVTDYSVGDTGIVTLASPGTDGHSLKWTGTFYYRCRFTFDEGEFDKFMYQLWEMKKLEFIGAPGNMV